MLARHQLLSVNPVRLRRVSLDSDPPILHLTSVTFQTDRTGCGNLQSRFDHFIVTGAVGYTIFHDNDQLIPVACFVVFERLVGPSQRIVTTLQLRLANEYTTVGIGSGSKFQFEL